MNIISGPRYSGTMAGVAAVYKAMGLSEKEAAQRILRACNRIIKGKKGCRFADKIQKGSENGLVPTER